MATYVVHLIIILPLGISTSSLENTTSEDTINVIVIDLKKNHFQ